jgi:sugar phosphate permease
MAGFSRATPVASGSIASPRIKSIQRWALSLLVIGGVVNYVDRATLAVGNTYIQHDLGISVGEMGVLLSAFLWAYAFSQLPVGGLIDRLGPRLLLGLGMFLWSLAQVLGGVVGSFHQFIGARVLLGIGEAPQFPSGARVVRDWFNIRSRGTATGIFNCSSSLGSFIAVPLLTFLMLTFSWRWMFIIMGVAGIVIAVVWWAVHRDPVQIELTPEERAYLTEGDETGHVQRATFDDWRRLFAFRTTWGMIAGYFGNIYVLWIYTAWLPFYLEHDRHISVAKTGFLAAIPFFWGVVGGLLGGWIADLLVRRGVSPMGSRKYPMLISLIGMAIFTGLTAIAPNNTLVLIFISCAMFLCYISTSTAWAMASVAAPSNCTASLGAIQNFGGYFGGALAPLVTGMIVQSTGSFAPALYVGVVIALVSAVLYGVLVGKPVTPGRTVPAGF